MRMLLMLPFEAAATLLPFAVAAAVLRARRGRRLLKEERSPARGLLVALFALYITAVFHFTGAGTLYDALRLGTTIQRGLLNLTPLVDGLTMGHALNVALFLPLGVLLPGLWPGLRRWWRTGLAGLGFSLLIEASQLLNHRATDVDDLMTNTLGALLGYLLYRLSARLVKWPQTTRPAWEAAVYIGAMFLGRFLLYNEMGLARIIFGF